MEKEFTLTAKNGIKVHGYKNNALHSFYISLFLKAGSMYEEEGECGITHFLEHALIRNVNAIYRGELYSILDKAGVEFNASTYSEMVQFYLSGGSRNFSLGTEIITKILSPIILSSDELATERERIKAEIRESDDRTSLSAFASGIAYEGTSLSRPILGTLGNVSKIGLKRLEEYRKKVFNPENIFFYLTGNFTDADAEGLVELLSKIQLEEGERRENIAPVPSLFCKREKSVHLKNADYTMVRFNFDIDMTSLHSGAVDLLYDVLLGGYNSRLFIEMSEKRGLFYDLSGSAEKYSNLGGFTFSFEVRGGSVYEAIESTVAILKELKEKTLPEDCLMKVGYVENGELLYDDVRELNFTFAYDCHIMNAPYRSVYERADYYSDITPNLVRDTAQKLFCPSNLTLALKGNKHKIDTERIERLIEQL